MEQSIAICSCGHEKHNHKPDKEGMLGYCKEYLYGDFEMKCTCQQFNPFMELTDADSIYDLTDDSFVETDEDDGFE